MIKNIKLKFGKKPGLPSTAIQTTPVTVFVGPNNSGKSKVLSEISRYCHSGTKDATDVIIDEMEFHSTSSEVAEEKIRKITLTPTSGDSIPTEHILIGNRGVRHQIHYQQYQRLLSAIQDPSIDIEMFCRYYLSFSTLFLNGVSRINLIGQQPAGDLQQPPHSSLQVLFKEDTKRKNVRDIIHDAFGSFFVIDPTNIGHLRIRLSNRPPVTDMEERGLHDEAVRFHGEAMPIENTSDGVKAFTSIITEIIAGDPVVLLIDEPEAFLHPSLSYKLGKEIASTSSGSEKRLFVSTHSPDFIMGCIQSGAPVNIMRLTYRDGIPTARILSNEDILRLMRNPLLRSTGILSALFYEHVIVTESDADRAFYQEINERLLRFKPETGIPNCLFINAQNKQTIQTIIRPLRELGIPVAGIVDVDILKEGGTVWTNFLASGFIPDLERDSLAALRASVKRKFDAVNVATGKDMKKDGGLELLLLDDKEAANNLFDRLAEYGLFVVRKGELESWLPQLDATGHGPLWLVEMFEKMGEDPESLEYVKPSDNDVWSFLGEIRQWLTASNRKGIPD